MSGHYNELNSKPAGSRYGCSRLSPFLTWGNLSLQQAYQYLWNHYDDLEHQWPLRSFGSRLKWHCHFIQKFEAEPRIEFENMNRGYDDIRTEVNPKFVEAWKKGQTGFPMVDACMRAVRQTGYINFRMRAMLVSVLTHHLWQPWQAGARFLGRQFLDFEPGIHYSQFQMQAGTMGVNSVRIYNPVKQGCDHDPEAIFVRQWVPELGDVPTELIHEPWKMTRMEQQMYNCRVGEEYPERLLDHKKAYKKANSRLWEKKSEQQVKAENGRILQKHVKSRS
ncbi:MAG: FAD-binding domain-containing protein [Fodinibius sp.]|nr:FAD-binding domain-containing protein [Fodinibius sp.]